MVDHHVVEGRQGHGVRRETLTSTTGSEISPRPSLGRVSTWKQTSNGQQLLCDREE